MLKWLLKCHWFSSDGLLQVSLRVFRRTSYLWGAGLMMPSWAHGVAALSHWFLRFVLIRVQQWQWRQCQWDGLLSLHASADSPILLLMARRVSLFLLGTLTNYEKPYNVC